VQRRAPAQQAAGVARRLAPRRGTTPPSSGRQKGCAFLPPLMSNGVPRVSLKKFCAVHRPLRSGASHASAAVVAAACLAARASHATARRGRSSGHRSTVTASGELQQVLRHCRRGAKRSKDPELVREQQRQRVRLGATRPGSAPSAEFARAACASSECSARIRCMKHKHRVTPSSGAASGRSGTRSCATARHNTSIERTYNGGRPCAVLRASRAPLYAAHVER
jgi:hypothetical protein